VSQNNSQPVYLSGGGVLIPKAAKHMPLQFNGLFGSVLVEIKNKGI